MALGDEIAIYLAGAGIGLTLTTSGTPVYGVPFPPDAQMDAAVCVVASPGRESMDAFGPSLTAPVFVRPRFSVIGRDSTNNQKALVDRMTSISKKLRHLSATLSGSTGGSVNYGFVKALSGEPFFIGFDENQRCQWSQTFEAVKGES